MKSLTYGTLPSFEAFEDAWEDAGVGRVFHIRNCKRVGDWDATRRELYAELEKAVAEWNVGDDECGGDFTAADEAGDWASCVLQVLGFEWV